MSRRDDAEEIISMAMCIRGETYTSQYKEVLEKVVYILNDIYDEGYKDAVEHGRLGI